MSRVGLWNVGALVVAVALSTAIVWVPALRRAHAPAELTPATHAEALVDHSGTRFERATYNRIVALSSVADELLLALCEPDRILAFTSYSAHTSPKGYRFAGKPTFDGEKDFERLLATHPDLVLVSRIGDPRPVQRMREAGLAVYDLGEMRGMSTLLPNIHEVATLIGHPERGDAFARTLAAQMATVAADVPASRRRRGMYLSSYGGHLYGGGAGTSYDDVLRAAGLVEAAEGYHDWPEYSAEQVVAIDPEIIVTNREMRGRICEHAGLAGLRACGRAGEIVEIDGNLIGDPGPEMVEAAEEVRGEVYGKPAGGVTTGGAP